MTPDGGQPEGIIAFPSPPRARRYGPTSLRNTKYYYTAGYKGKRPDLVRIVPSGPMCNAKKTNRENRRPAGNRAASELGPRPLVTGAQALSPWTVRPFMPLARTHETSGRFTARCAEVPSANESNRTGTSPNRELLVVIPEEAGRCQVEFRPNAREFRYLCILGCYGPGVPYFPLSPFS